MVQVGHRHIFAILTAVCCLFGWAAAHAQNVLSVQVDAADPIEFADFDTGWAFAMTQTGSETDLFDSDYTFDTDEGTTRGRLFLRGRFTIPPNTLDIDPVSDASTQGKVQAQKLLVRDKLYIRTNGHLYDAMGNLIK